MAAITTTGTLTAGNSRTFDLAPGSALTLTLLPNCRVRVTETPETVSASDVGGNSPRTHDHQLAGVVTYGPYAMGGSVVVENASNSGSTVTWGRKDTVVTTDSTGTSLVSGDGSGLGPLKLPAGYGVSAGSIWLDFSAGTWTSSGNGTAVVSAGAGLSSTSAMVLTRVGAGTYVAGKKSSGVSITLQSTDVLTLVIDSISAVTNDQVRIELSSDGFSAKSLVLASAYKTTHGSKMYLSFVVSDATLNGGELTTNTFNYVGVRLTSSTDGATCRVLGVLKNCRARPKLVMDFDDAFASQWAEIFPYLARRGLVGSIGVIKRTVGKAAGDIDSYDYATLTQLQEMESAGWAMLTHGYYSHATFASRALLLADVIDNRDYVNANFTGGAGIHYVLPGGIVSSANDTLGVLADAGMVTARTVDANPIFTHKYSGQLGLDSPYGIFSRDLSQTTTYTVAVTMMDRAIATGATFRCHGHRAVATVADANNELSITDWRSFADAAADRVRDGLIDNMTLPQWYAGL